MLKNTATSLNIFISSSQLTNPEMTINDHLREWFTGGGGSCHPAIADGNLFYSNLSFEAGLEIFKITKTFPRHVSSLS